MIAQVLNAAAQASLAADRVRCAERLAQVQAGLGGDDDWYWRGIATRRIQALEDDGALFGLVDHEVAELAQLCALVGRLTNGGD